MSEDIVAMARAAMRDERLSDGALYGKLADEIERLRNSLPMQTIANQQTKLNEAAAEIERLRAQTQRALDHYDMRSEIYTTDADVAAGMAAILHGAVGRAMAKKLCK